MNVPKISVIIPTYQGAQRVVRMLRCLADQSFRDFEAVVIIDGSNDGTYELLTGMSWSFRISVINQANKGRAGARNTGVRAALGAILVFLDDDVVFDGSLLERYYDVAAAGQSIVVGAEYPIATSEHVEFFEYASYLNNKWTSASLQPGPLKLPYLNAGNMLMTNHVFVALGMFDERLRDAEDFDLAVKAFEQGISIYFDPSILAGHHLQKDFRTYVRRLMEYDAARKAQVKINPAVGKYVAARQNLGGFKKFLYRVFARRFMITLIDRGIFRVFPKKIRFPLYDFLLTAYSRTRKNY